jgi:hypothetical protein
MSDILNEPDRAEKQSDQIGLQFGQTISICQDHGFGELGNYSYSMNLKNLEIVVELKLACGRISLETLAETSMSHRTGMSHSGEEHFSSSR